jgi:hypothetical protein
MSAAAPRQTQIRSASWAGTLRMTLGGDGLLVETRDAITGAWSPSRQLFYDEIQAVYSYRIFDWAYLPVAILYGVGGGIVLLIAGLAGDAKSSTWMLGYSLLALMILALAVYRIFVVQRSMVRVDAVTGPLVFSTRHAPFVQELMSRLPAAQEAWAGEAAAAPAPPSPAGPVTPPAATGWGPPPPPTVLPGSVSPPAAGMPGGELPPPPAPPAPGPLRPPAPGPPVALDTAAAGPPVAGPVHPPTAPPPVAGPAAEPGPAPAPEPAAGDSRWAWQPPVAPEAASAKEDEPEPGPTPGTHTES